MVSLLDVARRSRVSAATVSRVINHPERVARATRERVEQAIRELGYRPSRVARRLRVERGPSRLIGVLLSDIQNPFFADLARGVEDVAHARGYAVLLGNSDEDEAKARRYVEVMRAELVDGVILPPTSDRDEAAIELARSGAPLVCVDRRLGRESVDSVLIDNVRGAYDATSHLIRLGHRRIAFIEGLPRISTSRERLDGYTQALVEHGIEPDAALVRQGDSRQGGGRRMTEALLGLPDPPTALLVGNNLMTLGALEAVHGRGLRIPDDVAVVGYDDMPWALAFDPPLTAVRQSGYEVGRRAAELLFQRLDEPGRSTTVVLLQPELVVRGSCGAVVGRDAPQPALTP
ncbi:MAG TPA: LacI family DNA-binding transcriptional regulator [Longimicrobiales bacterium]